MKAWPIQTVMLETEDDVVGARRKARRIAALLGFNNQDQTRIATAVSEIARNAFSYAKGGKAEFGLLGRSWPDQFSVTISDRGPGIADLAGVLAGRFESQHGMGLGLAGARRLMDAFTLEARPGGGLIAAMTKSLPTGRSKITAERLSELSRALSEQFADDPMGELRAQNQELLQAMEALEQRRLEATRLTEELAETNKGVVALYAELQSLNETLERRVEENVAARLVAEDGLRQSQKMEAVGQLTGGIAHDFNNLLMVIGGSVEMLRKRVNPEPRVTRLLDAATQAVARGSSLNQKLLAFARRQDLKLEVISIDELLPSCQQLVERAVREDIALQVLSDARGCYCHADAHQLETAILNLAINARDAMPKGGRLTITARATTMIDEDAHKLQAKPGDYIVFSVADTGSGMSPEIMTQVFEPFFTTKPVGQGTGLGLSQVYGFVRQSGGAIGIESALGVGTTVRVFIPQSADPELNKSEPSAAVAKNGKGEIVLVVEDDPAVRAIASELLVDLGYQVIEAASARIALGMLDHEAVDLVLSDVILPDGLSGVDLATELAQRHPDLPVLLTSGYTAQRLSPLDGGKFAILRKPYDEVQLAEAVRSAMSPI